MEIDFFLKIQFLATKEPWIWNRQHFNVLFPWQKRIRCCICIALAIANWWVHKEFTKSNHKNFLREKSACLNKANSIALNWACSAFLPLFCRLFVSSSPYSALQLQQLLSKVYILNQIRLLDTKENKVSNPSLKVIRLQLQKKGWAKSERLNCLLIQYISDLFLRGLK